VETWQALGSALARTGMSDDEAALVMGGNMVRVAREVWR
jgi:membrane dipeptidase